MDLGWEGVGTSFKRLAEMISSNFHPEVVVGIAKGGVIPAVFLASAFRVDFYPIKLSSRKNEVVVREKPIWYVRPTADAKGQRVLLVDDICVAGRTLEMAKKSLLENGALEVRTATLAVHGNSILPDYFAIKTDDCIIFPWDKETLISQKWIMNPEYQAAIDEIEKDI